MGALHRSFIYTMISLLFCWPFTAFAQWNKPSSQWSDNDVKKLLNNSPWVKTASVALESSSSSTTGSSPSQTGRLEMPRMKSSTFYIRIISAKPIREALRRSANKSDVESINQLIDSLDTEHNIIFSIICGGCYMSADDYKNQTMNNTFLKVGELKIPLEKHYSSVVGHLYVFPRVIDGKPFIMSGTEEIKFHTQLSSPSFDINVTYKIKDMTYDGKLEY